jgi:hypothetical protein
VMNLFDYFEVGFGSIGLASFGFFEETDTDCIMVQPGCFEFASGCFEAASLDYAEEAVSGCIEAASFDCFESASGCIEAALFDCIEAASFDYFE